ncbi:MAG: acetolactate synthase [Verrucomicrobiales bacterium]
MPISNSTTNVSPAIESGAEPVRQYSIFLENRVGALFSVIKLIGDAGVYVLGLSVQDSVDMTLIRMVVTDPETVETVFMEKGIGHTCADIIVVELPEGPATIPKVLAALLEAESNIHFSYPLLVQPRGKAALALYVDDVEFASSALFKNGFKLLHQGDLSR